MKMTPFVLLALLAPLTTFAWPAVGDRAVYTGTHTADGVTSAAEVVVFMASYDDRMGQFIQHVQTRIGQNVSLRTVTTDESKVPTPRKMKQLLRACAASRGYSSMTVPAGTYRTCKLGHTYLAQVPFGMIRYVGEGFDIRLVEFRNGSDLE